MGCDDKERGPQQDTDASVDALADKEADALPEGEEATEDEIKLTADDVAPIFYTTGTADTVPGELVVRTELKLAQNTSTPLVESRNELVIEPATKGTLKRTSHNAITFVPATGFKPGTTYEVKLASISAMDELFTPERPWTHSFKTPGFAFLKMSSPVRTAEDTIATTLYFSAEPDSVDLKKFATWSISGKRPAKVSYMPGESAETVRVLLKDSVLKRKRDHALKLSLAAGVPYSKEIKAPEARAEAEVLEGKEMEILSASHQEGSSGYYIDVVCNDKADPGEERYYWDRFNYTDYYVSPTCLPDAASAKEKISFLPKVDFEIASSRGGFRLFGEFDQGVYTMQIEPGLMTTQGGVLRKSFKKGFTIEAREPSLGFSSKGRYIPTKAWEKLSLRHLNVEQAKVSVRHIPLDNLHFWLSEYREVADARTSNLLAEEIIDLEETKEDEESVTWIDLKALIKTPKPGVYQVKVANDLDDDALKGRRSKKYVSDSSRILITDLNLIAKRHATKPGEPFSDTIQAWTFGMEDLRPRIGVEVQAIRPSGDVLARCKTDIQGGCKLNLRTDDVDETAPFALIAKQKGDFTYIKFDELRTRHADEATSGEPYLVEQAYSVAAYGDRDLYRPGERVHIAAVLRMQDTWKAPTKKIPVEVEIRDARARVVYKKVIKSNGAGALEASYLLGDFAPTGLWRATFKIGKKQIQSYAFSVEEFVPERMRVLADFDSESFARGELISLNVRAKYLFGGSAEGSKVELRCAVAPTTFKPSSHKEYTYGSKRLTKDISRVELGDATEEIGADDSVKMTCPGEEALKAFDTSATITARVSVFEAGSGRTTSKTIRAPYHPSPYQIGLKSGVDEASEGKPFEVEGIIVDPKGQPTSKLKRVRVDLIRLVSEYGWYYDEDYGYERYKWYQRGVPEGTQEVEVTRGGTFKITLTPRHDGSAFIVRVRGGSDESEAVTDLEVDGRERYYSWYGDSSSDTTPSPETAASIMIEAPDRVEVGQISDVTFNAPFKGRALITIETHEVIKHEWREVEAGKNTFSFKLKTFHPNVYFSAFIVKDPHLDSKEAFLPGRAMGVASIKVAPTPYSHHLTIKAPREVRAESELKIDLDLGGKTQGETWVTVAVVDEGVLSLTNYETPELAQDLFTPRALGVDTFDTVGWGLKLESMRPDHGGGDDYEEGEVDASGEDNAGLGRPKAIKPVALWSGLVKVPTSGKATVSFKLPLYRGALRVMASSVSKVRVGTAEAEVIVRDPLNIQTTLPRFMVGGDEVHVPVFVTNTSGSTQEVKVSFAATEQPLEGISTANLDESAPLIELINPQDQALSLEDGESDTVIFRVKALRQAGIAKFRVVASGGGDISSYDEAIVPFIPAGPREREVTRLTITDTLTDLTSTLDGWEPTSEHSTFWLTTIPHGEAFDHLKFLVRYPYGCIEQTTSSTRPLLFIGDILKQVAPEVAPSDETITTMVDHGIRRIFSMQTSSGGFAYWPGRSYPDAWGTAYATHMLLDAKEAGFDVSQERLDKAIEWLEGNVTSRSYDYAEPYMHYVLALAGKGKKGRIKQLIKLFPPEPTGEDAEKLYMLQAALYTLGDQRYKDELLAPDVSSLREERRYGYSYYSDRRRRAFVLSTFYDLFGADQRGEALMNLVGRSLSERASHWYTTQEIVWGVTALGKWARGGAQDIGDSSLLINNAPLAPMQTSKKSSDKTWSLMRASEYDAVQIKLEKKPEGRLYLVVSSEGIRRDPELTYGGDGFSLDRTYFNSDGERITLSDIALGDIVYSQLRITNKTSEKIEHVALVERFPAGFEPENASLGGQIVPEALTGDAWGHQHMNVRDDRVEVFNTLRPKQSATVTIALRATSAGAFKAPSAHAEAMYDPSKWARVRPVDLKILGPWQD